MNCGIGRDRNLAAGRLIHRGSMSHVIRLKREFDTTEKDVPVVSKMRQHID